MIILLHYIEDLEGRLELVDVEIATSGQERRRCLDELDREYRAELEVAAKRRRRAPPGGAGPPRDPLARLLGPLGTSTAVPSSASKPHADFDQAALEAEVAKRTRKTNNEQQRNL